MPDGTHTATLGPVRVDLQARGRPVRLNLTEGQYVGGQRVAATAAATGRPGLSVDGRRSATSPGAGDGPRFAFEATNTDAFFRNGVKLGDEVLTVFDEGFYEAP